MKTTVGNIWVNHPGNYITVTTNGFVKNNGECVMGRGIAYEAKTKFPELPRELGTRLKQYGNQVFVFPKYKIITVPVKRVWWEKAELEIIEKSLQELVRIQRGMGQIYTVPLGCGNGKLEWSTVRPLMEQYLDDQFTVYVAKA